MSRFNTKKTPQKQRRTRLHPDATTNHEGGLAFRVSPEAELVRRVCAGFLGEPKFYEPKGSETLDAIRELAGQVDREFLLKLGAFARIKGKMRAAPILLLALAGRMGEAPRDDLRRYAYKIIRRADEPAELLAAWKFLHGDASKATGQCTAGMPRQLLKGISDAIGKFDEYQLAKYRKPNADITLRDVFRMVRPKPATPEREGLYKRVVTETLKTPETWERKISTGGSTSENWDEISSKMGFMAMLRNLRNFEQTGARKAIERAIQKLRGEKEVASSKQLPFRFLAAERHVESTRLKDAIRMALELSVQNMPRWPGKTAIFADLSGSMDSAVSKDSEVSCKEVASVLCALACHLSEDYLVGAFGSNYADVSISRMDSVLTNAQKVRDTPVGHATNAFKAIERLLGRTPAQDRDLWNRRSTTKRTGGAYEPEVVDRVVILSDEQTYDNRNRWGASTSVSELWQDYRKIAPQARLYTINLNNYGAAHMPKDEPGVTQLTGWSENVLEFVTLLEQGDLVETIRNEW